MGFEVTRFDKIGKKEAREIEKSSKRYHHKEERKLKWFVHMYRMNDKFTSKFTLIIKIFTSKSIPNLSVF